MARTYTRKIAPSKSAGKKPTASTKKSASKVAKASSPQDVEATPNSKQSETTPALVTPQKRQGNNTSSPEKTTAHEFQAKMSPHPSEGSIKPPRNPYKKPRKYFSPPRSNSVSKDITTFVDTLYTESAGVHGEFIVVTGVKTNGEMSWLHELYNPTPKVLFDEKTWDCRIQDYLHLRVSREDNSKVPCAATGKSASYSRFGFLSMPVKEEIEKLHAFRDPLEERDELFFEKCLRNEVDKVIVDANRNRVSDGKTKILTVYAPWNAKRHSKTAKNPAGEYVFRPLDHIFVDAAVGKILQEYTVTKDLMVNPTNWYNQLVEWSIEDSFFSRGSDGMYSTHAQEHFGYPSDRVVPENSEGSTLSQEEDPIEESTLSQEEDPIEES